MNESDNSWRSFRVEKEKLEGQIDSSNDYILLLDHLKKMESSLIFPDPIDLTNPSFDDQIKSIVLGAAYKIQRRRRSFFGRVLFVFIDFLLSFFTKPSIENDLRRGLIDSDRADFIDFLDTIKSIVSERRESYIRVYKRLSKAARGGRIIDIRRSTRRFKFLRIYSNNIDEEDLIAKLNIRIDY